MKSNQLTTRKVNREGLAPGYYLDGGGLYLQVSKTYGTRSWVFRYTAGQKENGRQRMRDMGLGSAGKNGITLEQARRLARECREHLQRGDDPIELRRAKRDRLSAENREKMSFREAAEKFIDLHAPTWKNEKHRGQWKSTLKSYAYPSIGSRPVSVVDGAVINDTLSPIWLGKRETASRVKQRIERVVQWVKDGMPPPQETSVKTHHAAMQYADIPEFMVELRKLNSVSARALQFLVLTAARTGDVIGAKWADVDLKRGIWEIRDGRHKTGKHFEIPLSPQAQAILEALPTEKKNPFVFIGAKSGEGLSNAAMAELLKGMHKAREKSGQVPWLDKISRKLPVPHGFRSSFRDWGGDCTAYQRETIEAAMSHQIKDKSEAAYARSTGLPKRKPLMEDWAKYCDGRTGKVSPMKRVA